MKKYLKIFALLSMLLCLNACDSTKHPTGDPYQDAVVLKRLINNGDLEESSQFMDEILPVYLQQYSLSDHEAYKKIDEFWEWNGKLK